MLDASRRGWMFVSWWNGMRGDVVDMAQKIIETKKS
jgi:hypothetical protein